MMQKTSVFGPSDDGSKPDCHTKTTSDVYVIDDDIEIRRSLDFLLSTAGWTAVSFASASDFLNALPELRPAPILLDIRMPKIDGIQLMTILSDKGIEWPVIVVTAHGHIPLAVQTIKLGAFDFLEKPFKFEVLEASIRAAFQKLFSINGTISD